MLLEQGHGSKNEKYPCLPEFVSERNLVSNCSWHITKYPVERNRALSGQENTETKDSETLQQSKDSGIATATEIERQIKSTEVAKENLPSNNASSKGKVLKSESDIEATDKNHGNVILLQRNQLLKFDDPEMEISNLKRFLGSSNQSWTDQYDAVDSIRRLALHDSDLLAPSFSTVIPFLQEGVSSLRSAMCRNSLFAMAELYESLSTSHTDTLLHGLENTVDVLLTKSVNEKKFIATAGISAIEKLAESLSSKVLLLTLLGHHDSKNPKASGAFFCKHSV